MKYIKALLLLLLTTSCEKKLPNISEYFPDYRLINMFSEKLKDESNLILASYGTNNRLPKNYQIKNGLGNFQVSYYSIRDNKEAISLNLARNLIIFVSENFLREINNNMEVRSSLDVYPFTADLLDVAIYFKDENRIELGQGTASVHFWEGKIKYEGYNIKEYRHRPPAVGKHYIIHEETYAEALDIVKKQGNLVYLE